MQLLTRYWFEFYESEMVVYREGYLPSPGRFGYLPYPGCGITAYNYKDSLRLLQKWVARGDEFPKFKRVIENVDVSELIESYGRYKFLPHLGCPAWRGIWHPAYNLWYGPDLN
jgi:hypothetical protein